MSASSYRPFPIADHWAGATVATAVAATVATDDGFADWGKGADFRQFQRGRADAVAAVAAVAVPLHPWGAGIARLQALACPAWLPADQWEGVVYRAVTLAREWGQQAALAGWTEIDLFGCNPQPWKARADRDGLALALANWRGPISVHAVETGAIVLNVDHGRQLRFYHAERAGSVPMWIGYAQEGGP